VPGDDALDAIGFFVKANPKRRRMVVLVIAAPPVA
jgi:hypothetical protein